MPALLASTLPLTRTPTLPAQVSLAVAPGSLKLPWHSTVIGLAPFNVITGGIVSSTVTTEFETTVP